MNNLDPSFMKNSFKSRETSRSLYAAYKMNINQVTYGTKSLRTYEQKVWNILPFHINSGEYLRVFRNTIKKLKR